MKKPQRGFAVLELFLVLVFGALLVGVGWYVWRSSNKANDSLDSAAATNSQSANFPSIKSYEDCLQYKTSTLDQKSVPQTCTAKSGKKFSDPNPTKGWEDYSSKAGKYSLKHPAGWDEKVCDPAADDLTLHLGPVKATSANCSTGQFSQIVISSTPAVPTESEQTLGDDYYKNQTSKSVTVDGVKGVRQTAKLKVAQNFGQPKLPVDTTAVRYIFLTPGRSYIIIYSQTPSGDYSADNLAAFDYLVQHTLKLTN